jgi:hypothetical protein
MKILAVGYVRKVEISKSMDFRDGRDSFFTKHRSTL